MVKGGEYRLRDYTPDLLDGAAERSIFLKSQVRTGTTIVGSVSLEDPAKVGFAHDHDMVETFASRHVSRPASCRYDPATRRHGLRLSG